MTLSIVIMVVGFVGGMGLAFWLHCTDDTETDTNKLTNEELATALRAMKATGISPTRQEAEFLEEAAERLERYEDE